VKKRSERGSVILEFAMILPVFCLIGFGLVDVEWLCRDAQAIEYIVTESARCEAVKAVACPNESQTQAFVMQLAQNVHLPVTKEQVLTPACTAQTCSVSINFPFQPLGVWFPKVTISRTGQAAVTP
jgi:Flp pilus assembly protein TadG